MGRRLAAFLLVLTLGACGGNADLFGERAEVVVQTPDYGDNRVFYFSQPDDKNATSIALLPSFKAPDDKKVIPQHNLPLSIILSSASLPQAAPSTFALRSTRDVVLLVQFGAESGGGDRTLAVWYQRNVPPDQPLNFGNLIIFHEPAWDDRVAPFFRIRLIDVAAERNRETLAELSKITNFSRAIGLFVGTPLNDPAINALSNAAKLVLANGRNKVLLDYSVQFFSDEAADSAPAAGLTRLRKGSFMLLGRPIGLDRSYWAREFQFDRITHDIKETLNSVSRPVASPFVQMTVSDRDLVVPTVVQRRSTAIQNILTAAGTQSTEALVDASDSLSATVRAFVLTENVRRFRSPEALEAVTKAIAEGKVGGHTLSQEDLFVLYRTLNQVSGCGLSDKVVVEQWWDRVGPSVKFESNAFKVTPYAKCS